MKRLLRSGATVAALLTMFPVAGWTAEEAARADNGVIEEILVTTKRGTGISTQDMTEAVSAFSGEALERMFATTLEDFNTSVPNVQLEHVVVRGHSEREFVLDDWRIDHGTKLVTTRIPGLRLDIQTELVHFRSFRPNGDCTSESIAPVQDALRSAQRGDFFNIEQVQ